MSMLSCLPSVVSSVRSRRPTGGRRLTVATAVVLAAAATVLPARGAAGSPFDHPGSFITAPVAGSLVTVGSPVTVLGGSHNGEAGGIVRVDVSLDGGTSWQPANLVPPSESWSFTFTPAAPGVVTIVSRAATVDVVETPTRSATIKVAADGPVQCPCVLRWPGRGTPPINDPDDQPVELGLRFQTDRPGFVTGLLFARYPDNTGPHIGNLWSADGELLATRTLAATTDRFPYVRFDQPVPIEADRTYVISYYTPSGHYAATEDYFDSPVVAPPFRTVVDDAGGSGVYRYGLGGGFPEQTWHASNYWVEPVLAAA